MKHYLRFLISLLVATVWCMGGYGQETVTIWSENWSSASANDLPNKVNSNYSSSGNGTKVYTTGLASGGTASPELLIAKNTGSWTVKINDLKNCSGTLTLTYMCNKNLAVQANGTTITLNASGKKYTSTFNVSDETKNLTIIFTNNNSSNARIDDVVLTGTSNASSSDKTATSLSFPKQSFSFATTDDLSTFKGQTATLKAGEKTLTDKTITYSKTGDDIISTFDESTGALTLNGNAGTATIKASFDGSKDDTYASSTASYTISVNQAYSTIASFKDAIPSSASSTSAAVPFSLKLTDALVTYVNGKKAYVQDATSGVLLYDANATENAFGLVAGQKFNGKIDVSACLFNGMAEVTAWTPDTDVKKEENVDIPVKTVTLADLNGSDYSKYECVRVKVENATVTTAYNTQKKSTITQGDQSYLIHGEITGLDVNKDDVCDFIGYPIYWKTKTLDEHQLSIWSQDDITVKSSVVATTLSLDPATKEYKVEKGKETAFTAPKVKVTDANDETVADAKISYKSSNTNVATVDAETGKVAFGNEFGTTTITASYAGDATHKAAKDVTYTIIYGKVKTTMAWSAETANAKLGEEFTAPTLSLTADGASILDGKTIKYESTEPTVAEISNDGTVSVKSEGTTTITATFAGDDTYAESTASYTLTVVDPNKMEVTFDFANNHYGYNLKTAVPEGDEIVSGDVTITHINKGKSSETMFYDDSFRLYDGAKLSISVPVGYNITKVIYNDKKSCANFTCDPEGLTQSTQTWTGNTNSLLMTFSGGSGQFSSITVSYSSLPTLTLDESSDNASVISENVGKTVNVTMARTISNTYLNPVCFPFAMSKEQIAEVFGEGSKVYTLNENVTDGVLKFDAAEDIAARTPYILESKNAVSTISLKNITFAEKTDADYTPAFGTGDDAYSFVGVYSPYSFSAIDGSQLFVGKDNNLYKPTATGQKIKGFRAYFTVEGSDLTKALRVSVNGGTSSIDSLMNGKVMTSRVYNLNGQFVGVSLDGLAKGVYVMNGKKYVVK